MSPGRRTQRSALESRAQARMLAIYALVKQWRLKRGLEG